MWDAVHISWDEAWAEYLDRKYRHRVDAQIFILV